MDDDNPTRSKRSKVLRKLALASLGIVEKTRAHVHIRLSACGSMPSGAR
jgi:hypothetical protein